MEQLYYLNRQQFTSGDVKLAWEFVNKLLIEDKNIDTVSLLVLSANQYEPFVTKELRIPLKECKQHVVPNSLGIRIQVHTVKTYKPGYTFEGHEEYELLLAIGVPPKDLEQFTDKSRVKYWVIVPWQMEENEAFLKLHEGIDIESGIAIKADFFLDSRVCHAIEWLKSTSFPNSGFVNDNDHRRLKQMSNALSHFGVKLDHDAVLHYCINNGIWDNDGANKIADYFTRAQSQRFSVGRDDYDFLKEMMEREDWA